ncbi:pimeloyl-ACP methyl ester carboxylesterase [Pedobacter sp. UYP24]
MIQKKEFSLAGAEGKVIYGDYTSADTGSNIPTVVFVHGFKGFKDWGAHNVMAEFFALNGFRYLKFNFSHGGVTAEKRNDVTDLDSFAANTVSKELYDLNAVIDYTENTFLSSPIFLIGHSRGGGLVIIKAATDERVKKLVTWSSIADFSSLWKKAQEEEWIKTGQIFVENARTKEKMPLNSTLLTDVHEHTNKFNILKAARKIEIPWLILHGDSDVNVEFTVAQQLAQQQVNAEIQIIKGANHVYGASHPYVPAELPEQLQQVADKTLNFFKKGN